MHQISKKLASHGGRPVRTGPWPSWPAMDDVTAQLVQDVLYGKRWAISEMNNGSELYERRFARAFADYNNIAYCVPTTSGTGAITIAFEALGLERGSEVLVPGLTWVACASALANIGLVPVLVDIEYDSLCMSPEAAAAQVTPRTAGILLVHLACNVANIDAFKHLASRHGLAVVEDCAQAHGAEYRGEKVGTWGDIGVFSMQESKVLTAGEGGAAITSDRALRDAMAQYRADGRDYARGPVKAGDEELSELGSVQGRNLCLSEVQAALLLGGLRRLDNENQRRQANASHLDECLASIEGLSPLQPNKDMTRRTYYQYVVQVDLETVPEGESIDDLRRDLMAELGIYSAPLHDPLNASPLYDPLKSPEKYDRGNLNRLDPRGYELPAAHRAKASYLTLPHRVLLGGADEVEAVAGALEKIVSARRERAVV